MLCLWFKFVERFFGEEKNAKIVQTIVQPSKLFFASVISSTNFTQLFVTK